MAETLFYVLAALAVACGVGVVRARMPLFSVLSLLGAFLCLAGIYLLAGFPFLAATQLLVYVGAIMVLFLFVIMLLNLGDAAEIERHSGMELSKRRLTVGACSAVALGLVGMLVADLGHQPFRPDPARAGRALDELEPLAAVLFSRYALAFEAASLLLLATMVAVIVLAKRQRGGREREGAARAASPARPVAAEASTAAPIALGSAPR